MNRNSESHFANVPQIEQKRSTFDRSCGLKTTLGTGFLTPIYFDEVLPGDTITLDTSIVARMSTPIFPVMDNVNIDLYYFFVPNRLVWDHWKEFCGESNVSPYETSSVYQIPQISFPSVDSGAPNIFAWKWADFSVADYFGLPTQRVASRVGDSETMIVSALPFRAYCLIWNEFFRDQNLQDPVLIDTGDADIDGWSSTTDNGYSPVQSALHGFELLRAAKYHDYFTSCLPQPQAAPEVLLPAEGLLPVITDSSVMLGDRSITTPVRFQDNNGTLLDGFRPLFTNTGSLFSNSSGISVDAPIMAIPYNLSAELTPEGLGVSINDFRLAYAVQKFLELQGRGGRRYTELVRSFFGVTSPDARLQRPEYLGGKQIHVNIDQVVQTSATNEKSPIGTTSAFSLTGDTDSSFTYSATEHGMIIGLAVPRAVHSYQQGIEKKWTRRNLTDFYWTPFANIGEQPVYTRELYINEINHYNDVFGYQEAWAEYRYSQTHVTGAFRSAYVNSLDSWHYGDYYSERPTLSSGWIEEPYSNVARTLAVQTDNSQYQQFLVDLWFEQRWTRCMPVYSVPGIWDRL